MSNHSTPANLSILVAEEFVDRLPEVVNELRSAGMHIERVLESVGAITGSAPRDKVETLSHIAGVESVEPEREYQLPPPESDVQ